MSPSGQFPIFDGHNDVLLALARPERGDGRSFFARSERGHIDLPRAREGGFAGGFFAIFVPHDPASGYSEKAALTQTENGYAVGMAPALDPVYAQRTALALAALLFRLEAESAGQMKVARTADELSDCLQRDVLAAVWHFEGAEPIDPDLDALHVCYQAGLRSLGIVWSRPNLFGHGVPFMFPHSPDTGPGLTEAGLRLVAACNQLGILLDLAHLNEQGFWDVARHSAAPLVVTHAAAHALCPTTRNLTDKQLDAVGASNGVVGVNFHVGDLRADGHLDADVPLSALVRHIDYIANRIGIERVAFGSDFDGATMPKELGDVAGLPKLVAALRADGFDDDALRKLTHENWLRVLRQTWK